MAGTYTTKFLRLAAATETKPASTKPYGAVVYADPKNGKYPLNNEKRIRAAWAYINVPKNAAEYPLNGVTLSEVKGRIKAAATKIGIEISAGS
jgi:hypothetical protein